MIERRTASYLAVPMIGAPTRLVIRGRERAVLQTRNTPPQCWCPRPVTIADRPGPARCTLCGRVVVL